jgi:hypothetical protein
MGLSFSFDSIRAALDIDVSGQQARAKRAVNAAGMKARDVLRAQTQAAGLGAGVSNAWQVKLYPSRGRADNPASYVYSKAPRIVEAFSTGATITARNAEYLVIALPAAKALGLDRMVSRPGARGGGLPARYSNVTAAIAQFGALRFVPLKNGHALLVADSTRGAPAGRVVARQAGNGTALFLLLKSDHDRKALDLDAAAEAGKQAMLDSLG